MTQREYNLFINQEKFVQPVLYSHLTTSTHLHVPGGRRSGPLCPHGSPNNVPRSSLFFFLVISLPCTAPKVLGARQLSEHVAELLKDNLLLPVTLMQYLWGKGEQYQLAKVWSLFLAHTKDLLTGAGEGSNTLGIFLSPTYQLFFSVPHLCPTLILQLKKEQIL